MVEGKFKSSHYRKKQVKVPGGRTVERYVERSSKQPRCSRCKKVLHGIPRMTNQEAKNSPKTTKRPERPFGGVLCSQCLRKQIISSISKD